MAMESKGRSSHGVNMDRVQLSVTLPETDGDDSTAHAATIGRFESLGVLGRGGMGIVLRARDPKLDRPVALKLLHPGKWRGTADTIGESRLHREAQAMARLSHPNVVTVYEMGRIGDDDFIAMELIEGSTLRGWLKESPRAWSDIVKMFIGSGQGLAAAHAASLVHRDFKPENVLVDKQDRPRVSDFGLVAAGVAVPLDGILPTNPGERISNELTVNGAVVGTPAYMAPEQWAGLEVDERTDQFAFCVSLWESLHGERPFAGADGSELRSNVLAGQMRTPAKGNATRDISARGQRLVEAALRRGLATDPSQRFSSMNQLIAQLQQATVRSSKAPMMALAGAALVAGAAGLYVAKRQSAEASPCGKSATEMEQGWNAQVAADLAARFAATGLAFAPGEWNAVQASLDAYGQRWIRGANESCVATHEKKIQSQELLDKRTACLQRGKLAMFALVQTLKNVSKETASEARAAAMKLPDMEACDDLTRLGTLAPLPTDPALRAQISLLQQRLAQIEAAQKSKLDGTLLAKLDELVVDAKKIGYPSIVAEALRTKGELKQAAGAEKESESAYREAAIVAAEAKDDLLAARAWLGVLQLLSEQRESAAATQAIEPVVEAALRRAGEPRDLRFEYQAVMGVVFARREEFDKAYEFMLAAKPVAETKPEWKARNANDIAVLIAKRDRSEQALPYAVLADTYAKEAWGDKHPQYATVLVMHGMILDSVGRHQEAMALLAQAVAIFEGAFGRDSAAVSDALLGLGNVARTMGNDEQAMRCFDESIKLNEKLNRSAARKALPLTAMAMLLSETQRPAESLEPFTKAMEMLESTAGKDSSDYLMSGWNKAMALHDLGRCAEAAPLNDAVINSQFVWAKPYGYLLRARCQIQQKQWAAVEKTIAAGDVACKAAECSEDFIGGFMYVRGQLLVESGRDKTRGMQLAKDAWTKVGDNDRPFAAAIKRWLDAQAAK